MHGIGLPLIERAYRAANPDPPFDLGYTNPFWTPQQPTETEQAAAPESAAQSVETPDTTDEDIPPVQAPPPAGDPHVYARQLLQEAVDEINAMLTPDDSAQRAAILEAGYTNPLGTDSLPKIEPVSVLEVADCERANALLAKLSDCATELGNLFSTFGQKKFQWLLGEKNRLAELCRTQQEVRDKARQALSDYLPEKRKRKEAVSAAVAAIRAHESEKSTLGPWPKDADLHRWSAKLRKLQAVLDEASLADAAALEEGRRLIRAAQSEQAKLIQLSNQYWIVESRLSGESAPDPQTGLMPYREA